MNGHSEKVAFIWSVADLLRGDYKASDFGKVILPFVVLRRLDCVLEATKQAVLDKAKAVPATATAAMRETILNGAAGQKFHNLSPYTFARLKAEPDQLEANLTSYLNGFSSNIRDIFIDRFELPAQIARLERSNLLFLVLSKFAEIDLHPDRVSNLAMGYIFEELIRRFSEQSNETAGEHFTPREVIRLMVNLLLVEDSEALAKSGAIRTIYDPACGTGGMLSVAEEYLREHNSAAKLVAFGQELNPETYAVCKSDMLIKGQDPDNIGFGNSFSEDRFPNQRFDYCISNPPFGVEWKKVEKEITEEHERFGLAGRFGAGLPRISDGSLLFVQHMISKFRNDGGTSRLAVVLNGSPLFTGGAGSGESEIRRWIIENDWLEAIIGLPDQLFYNTGISTYLWIITNRKSPQRKGKVQLIDATAMSEKMRRSLGNKRNQITNQTVEHAKWQYRNDRNPNDPLLRFKTRCLVHFAVDPDLVFMTTKLAGKGTVFLPFNKGRNNGAGNPDNPNGYKTAYLWEEVWAKDRWLDILARFVHFQRSVDRDGKVKEGIIFPRYHQLDAVSKVLVDVRAKGVGENYLIEHSAGSGKSNTIAWLAHRLSNLHDAADQAIFSSVIVITDRLVLDKQLQDTIYQFEHKQGVVQKIDSDSTQLAAALNSGVPIIISTIQKFSFILNKVAASGSRRYAVVVDEAHTSQTGSSATNLKKALAATSLEAAEVADADEGDDTEDLILKEIRSKGRQPNISFFAFTATPKKKTVELFGTIGADGIPRAFHLYAMRQAIEEKFILDVLANYTTYSTYYRFEKAMEDDPEVDKSKAKRALAQYASLHPHNLAQKAEVMIEHFRAHTRHKIGGRAKAMVVTRSRLHAVRYKKAFEDVIAAKGYTGLGVLVAFSGTVDDDGDEVTEVGMNGFGEAELPDRFESSEFHFLIVAEKYQTGFDQPLLHTMFVDKKLKDLKAVQTLSRLNRTCAGKEDTRRAAAGSPSM
jgi:type I restriction-modification system DNA methylase subunit